DTLLTEFQSLTEALKGDAETVRRINQVKQLYNDGRSAYSISRFNDATTKYNEAITKGLELNNPLVNDPIYASYVGLALVHNRQKDYVKMKEVCTKAVDMDPNNARGFYYLGISEEVVGNFPNAERAYLKSVELATGKDRLSFRYKLGVLYLNRMKEFDKAAQAFYSVIEIDAAYKNGKTFTYLGRSYLEAKQPENAINALQQAIAINNKDWEPHFYMSKIHNSKREFTQAVASANEGLKYRKNHGGLLIERGLGYKGLGQKVKALDDFNSAKKDRIYRKLAEHHILVLQEFDK
ncbi:MAG: tetratricopeptide repeat protein, partial [bacterium]|nr:tetratricopeptide repeat protein [bacterium]